MTFSVIAGIVSLAGLFLGFTDAIYLLSMVLAGAVLQLVGSALALIAGRLNVVPELGAEHE
ncbi:hypothetical protein [Arthrobacter woluwensis]|nr:hypothetical protein [Arthrobacter woluwensis]